MTSNDTNDDERLVALSIDEFFDPIRYAPAFELRDKPVKLADTLEIIDGRLYIDGKLFPYATADGYQVGAMSPRRTAFPSVTLTIVGYSVKAEDTIVKIQPLANLPES